MTTTENRGGLGPILLIVGRLALAGIFLFAAYAKLKPQAAMPWSGASIRTSLSMFAMQVDSYQLLPPQLVSPAAHFLPLFELFLGLWLLSGSLAALFGAGDDAVARRFFAMMVRTYAHGPGDQLRMLRSRRTTGAEDAFARRVAVWRLALAVTIGAFLLHRSRGRSGGAATSAPTAVVSTPQRAE